MNNDEDDIPTLESADDQPVSDKSAGRSDLAASEALHWTSAEDPEMARAIKAAQASFTEFARHAELEYFRIVPVFTHVGVKAFFANPTRPGSGEHMFVEQILMDGKKITGVLNSAPQDIPNLKEGQRVTFPVSDLSDWFLVLNDKGLGGFTIDVMKRQMRPEQLKQYESQPPLAWYRHRTSLDAQSELERIPVCKKCGQRDLIAYSYKNGVCGLCANGAARSECPTCGAPLFRHSGQPPQCAACLKPEPPDESDEEPLFDDPDGDIPVLTVAGDNDAIRLSRPVKPKKQRNPAPKPIQRSPSSDEAKPKPTSRHHVWLWIVLVLLGVGSCVTTGVVAVRKGGESDAREVAELVRRHPVVIEKLGGIDECRMNFVASLNADTDTNVFEVRGPKGRGRLVASEGFLEYESIKLRMAEGEWELLDGRENGVAENEPVIPVPATLVPDVQVPNIVPPARQTPPPQPAPSAARPTNSGFGPPPAGASVAIAETPLRPGTPVFALHGATWHPAEVLAVRPDGMVVAYWPHLGHDFNRILPRMMIAVSEETLAKLQSDPGSFSPSVELAEGCLQPPPDGYVLVPEDLKLLPGTPVKFSPAGRLMLDYTVVRDNDSQVAVVRDQIPIREESMPRRRLIIQKSVIEQLSEPDAEQKLAARLKEIQAKSPLRARPARTYRITLPIPDTAERVTKDTPLEVGTRCSAERARRWGLVTVKALRDNGDVEIQWDGWNSIEPVTRESLTIDKKTLAELEAKRKPTEPDAKKE